MGDKKPNFFQASNEEAVFKDQTRSDICLRGSVIFGTMTIYLNRVNMYRVRL